MSKEQELRLGCQHCSAQFHTQWERAEHERRDHLVIVKQDAPNYGFVSTPTDTRPEQLIHIDSTGRYVLNALGQYVGTLVSETDDPARRSSSDEAEVVGWQWSDFSGKWYTVDTARLSIDEQEELARLVAGKYDGRVRPLYASPSGVKAGVTEALKEALKLAKLTESLCAGRGDDDYVWGVQAKIEAAIWLLAVHDEGMGEEGK